MSKKNQESTGISRLNESEALQVAEGLLSTPIDQPYEGWPRSEIDHQGDCWWDVPFWGHTGMAARVIFSETDPESTARIYR